MSKVLDTNSTRIFGGLSSAPTTAAAIRRLRRELMRQNILAVVGHIGPIAQGDQDVRYRTRSPPWPRSVSRAIRDFPAPHAARTGRPSGRRDCGDHRMSAQHALVASQHPRPVWPGPGDAGRTINRLSGQCRRNAGAYRISGQRLLRWTSGALQSSGRVARDGLLRPGPQNCPAQEKITATRLQDKPDQLLGTKMTWTATNLLI